MDREYLPSEVTSRILRSQGRALLGQDISRGVRTASRLDILQSSCLQKISRNELNKYITDNVTFGIVEDYTYDNTSKLRNIRNRNQRVGTPGTTNILQFLIYSSDVNGGGRPTYIFLQGFYHENIIREDIGKVETLISYINSIDLSVDEVLSDYTNTIKYFDLITTYKILQSRTICIDISSAYAYNETMRQFDEIIDMWNNTQDFAKILSYLYMNMKVMNLSYPAIDFALFGFGETSYEVNESISIELTAQIDIIDMMIYKIRRYMDFIRNI